MEKLKISEICSINPRQDDNIPENSEISFIPMAAVSANGQVDLSDTLESSKVKNYTVFRNGDVLFAKITPCIDDDVWAVIKTTAVQHGYFDYTENKILPDNLEPRNQHEISVGDILITRAGPRSRCGVCCLVRKTKQRFDDKLRHIQNNEQFVEYIENIKFADKREEI